MKHFLFILCLFTTVCFISCNDKPSSSKKPVLSDTLSHSLNIYGKISNDEIIDKIFSSITDIGGQIDRDSIKVKRCSCDEHLLKVTLPEDFYFIKGHDGQVIVKNNTPGQSGQSNPNFGDIENIILEIDKQIELPYYSSKIDLSNYRLVDEPITNEKIYVKSNNSAQIKIAVFDSGLDINQAGLWSNQYKSQTKGCDKDSSISNSGWDFTSFRKGTFDDQLIKHGSRVSQLIALQFNNSNFTPQIIPYKVLDSNNQGSLFDLLCAMENARQNKLQIFNMSLGYYGVRDSIFTTMISRITNDNILVITAAGNQFKQGDRNLNTMSSKFFPAWYAKHNSKVFAITTHDTNCTVCNTQNYGSDFVLGVEHQGGTQYKCRFKYGVREADKYKTLYILGTSYAAPIFTGWLAKTYGNDLQSINSTNLPEKHGFKLCTSSTNQNIKGYLNHE